MSAPSMVSRSGNNLVVRSVVSGDTLFGTCPDVKEEEESFLLQHDAEEEYSQGELPQCKIKRNYSCPSCDYYTQNPRFYLYHQKHVHKEKIKIYECPNCLYASKHSQKLQRHVHMVHIMGNGKKRALKPRKLVPAIPPPPPQLQLAALSHSLSISQQQIAAYDTEETQEEETATAVSEPTYAEDGTQIFKCSVCSEIFKTETQLARHERQKHLKRKFYRCAKCNYVTHMKARYTKHVKYHSMPMIKCDLCDFKTPYKWNLDRHNKNHMGDGAFKCSLCNFTADIKQSLTVHEMNHHVPPVGHLLTSNRRRLRVGASDTQGMVTEEDQIEQDELELLRLEREATFPEQANPADFVQAQLDIPEYSQSDSNSPPPLQLLPVPVQLPQQSSNNMVSRMSLEDDRLITIRKYKCKMCEYEGNLGEVQRHESVMHNCPPQLLMGGPKKKAPRPIPNLIPIQGQTLLKPVTERKELAPIAEQPLAKESFNNNNNNNNNNNSIKDFTPVTNNEPVSNIVTEKELPADLTAKKVSENFKKKNASFFDKLKEKLMTSASESNLNCSYCGYEAKCLSEHMKHQRTHMLGTENSGVDSEENSRGSNSQNTDSLDQFSSTRCQHCRIRFKTNANLLQHLPNCAAIQQNALSTPIKVEDEDPEEDEHPDEEDEDEEEALKDNPDDFHPLENKVFVWNTINGENETPGEDFVEGDSKLASDESFSQHLVDRSLLGVEVKPGYGIIARTVDDTQNIAAKDLSIKKVFKCPHCSFWASTASRFHVHIVGHLNKRPFQCSLCYYSSNWRWDITKHIRLKTLRDPSHSRAKVLLTDETGRRNYSKYHKYLTTMRMELSAAQSALEAGGIKLEGGGLTGGSGGSPGGNVAAILGKIQTKLLPKEISLQSINNAGGTNGRKRVANLHSDEDETGGEENGGDKGTPKKRHHSENKRTMWKCKKCYFRDGDRSVVLAHVKEHYREAGYLAKNKKIADKTRNENISSPATIPSKQAAGREHLGNEECPDFMCETCPFIAGTLEELEAHCERHFVSSNTTHKCQFCPYYACNKQELLEHYDMHSEAEAEDTEDKGVIYACLACPYVATSHSQLVYHKNWHRPDNVAATHGCIRCTYGAPNNMFLSLHVRLHGRNNLDNIDTVQPMSKSKKQSNGGNNSNGVGGGNIGERKPADISGVDTTNYTEIPMVWVSKPMGISKMFKCRYCPHVNMRKSNIQEHEKMHGARADTAGQTAHQCTECNYVCNNPGVLSSHAKVHAAFFGTIVGIVDHTRSDEIQIEEMKDKITQIEDSFPLSHSPRTNRLDDRTTDSPPASGNDNSSNDEDRLLHFCHLCPARFVLAKEISIHIRFHQLELPFKCDACTYTARQKQHLMAHCKVHSDEYQERTNTLLNIYSVSEENPKPKVAVVLDDEGSKAESMWVVVNPEGTDNKMDNNQKMNSPTQPKTYICDKCPAEFFKSVALTYHMSLHGGPGPHKCRTCDYAVKTYGNLIRHEMVHQNGRGRDSEKQKPQKTPPPAPPLQRDPEFGLLIHGSPDFVYPTYVKNGKLKEKRYKCHKCPSAFEKREQYKIHLSLHGSKQRYNCERCDYSVKYYANYSQHIKKHEMNDASRKERKVPFNGNGCVSGDEESTNDWQEAKTKPIIQNSKAVKSLKVSVADQQALMVMQQRFISNSVSDKEAVISRCPYCPYANNRRDGVGNHVRCHTNNKGAGFSCKYCQYNVPQMHRLREHLKMHFAPIKFMKPEAYMKVDRLELYAESTDPNHNSAEKRILVFKDNGETFPKKARYEPELKEELIDYVERTERNGGRIYINLKTGAEEIELDEPEENGRQDGGDVELKIPDQGGETLSDKNVVVENEEKKIIAAKDCCENQNGIITTRMENELLNKENLIMGNNEELPEKVNILVSEQQNIVVDDNSSSSSSVSSSSTSAASSAAIPLVPQPVQQ